MRKGVGFAASVMLYATITAIGQAVMPLEQRLMISRTMQLSVAALQVCFLSAVVLCFFFLKELYLLTARIVKRLRKKNVAEEVPLFCIEEDIENCAGVLPGGVEMQKTAKFTMKEIDEEIVAEHNIEEKIQQEIEEEIEEQINTETEEDKKEQQKEEDKRATPEQEKEKDKAKDHDETRDTESKPEAAVTKEPNKQEALKNIVLDEDEGEFSIFSTPVFLHSGLRKRSLGIQDSENPASKELERSPEAVWQHSDKKLEILFPGEDELSYYIIKIHCMGLALWETFLCFDCTTRSIDICFIYGLVVGWLCRCIAKGGSKILACCLYSALCFTVLATDNGVMRFGVVRMEEPSKYSKIRDIFNLVVLPFTTGFFWTLIVPSTRILADVRRSIWTLILISITFPLYWTVIDQAILQSVLSGMPTTTFAFLIVVEPFFKCIGIYVLIYSIQSKHTLNSIVALTFVVGIAGVILSEKPNELHICSIGLLMLIHLVLMSIELF